MKNFSNPLFSAFFSAAKIPLVLSVVGLNLIAALLEGASFGCLLLIFQSVEGSHAFFSHLPIFIFNWLQNSPFEQIVSVLMGLAISLQILRSAMTYGGQLVMNHLSCQAQLSLQMDLFSTIFQFPYESVVKRKMGELMHSIQSPIHSMAPLAEAANRFFVSCLMMTALTSLLFVLSPFLTILLFALMGIFGLLQRKALKIVGKASHHYAEKQTSAQNAAGSILMGVREVLLYNAQKYFLGQVKHSLSASSQANEKLGRWNFLVTPLQEVTGIIVISIVLMVGMIWIGDLRSFPLLMGFLTLAYRFNSRLQIAVGCLGTYAFYKGIFEQMLFLLEEKPVSEEKLLSKELTFEKEISFQNVSYIYPSALEHALKEISFSFPKGSTWGIVGHSGAGKSTLIHLLLGLLSPEQGKILLDGISLNHHELKEWRNTCGIVLQDPYLFEGTILDNICLGYPASMEKIEEVIFQAGLKDYLEKSPRGLYSYIGERGTRLSSGEKQRIALARALLRNPQLLILDEATSHLDGETEAFIRSTLDQLKGEKTILLITHRLSLLAEADQILVLEKGRIVQRGNHAELIEVIGPYQRFWKLQNVHFENFFHEEAFSIH